MRVLVLLLGLLAGGAHACTVTLFGEIDMKLAQETAASIYACDKQDEFTTLFINSPGGSVVAGGMIVDAIRLAKHPVYTVDIAEAASMAAIIFEAGSKRIMWPHSFLMLHQARLMLSGSPEQVASELKLYGSYVPEYERLIAGKAQITVEQLRKVCADEWYLRADEAVRAHLADEVATEMGVTK